MSSPVSPSVPPSPPMPDEFGRGHRIRGAIRRRLGLQIARFRHKGVEFGPRCDVRSGSTFLVARGGSASFGPGCVLDRGFTLESRGQLIVGPETVFGHHCTVAADSEVVMGSHCLVGELVSIRDHDHAFGDLGAPIVDQGRTSAPVRIGDNVWIGAKVTITKGVTIGSGSVVGANAVVTQDIPPHSIAVGVPARVVGQREGSTERLTEP